MWADSLQKGQSTQKTGPAWQNRTMTKNNKDYPKVAVAVIASKSRDSRSLILHMALLIAFANVGI